MICGMDQPPAMPPTSSPAPVKKGMPGIAWVGIGCGGLLVIAIIVGAIVFSKVKGTLEDFAANPEKAAAEMIVSMNPELEMVSQDEENGTMTIRTKDGKEMTLSYQDIAEGKMEVTDADGNTTRLGSPDLSLVPAWVPKAPDLTEGISMFHTAAGGRVSGQFSGKSVTGVEDLKEFFENAASDQGLSSSSNSSTSMNGTSVATQEFTGGGKSLKIVITEKPGSAALINTNYSEN